MIKKKKEEGLIKTKAEKEVVAACDRATKYALIH